MQGVLRRATAEVKIKMVDQIVVRDWQLNIDVDMVLRGQGADPEVIRQRKPRLVEIAERALQEGLRVIEPAVVYRSLPVQSMRHERLTLAGGAQLTGPLIARQLGPAQRVTALVCTIGALIDERISALMWQDSAYALALDGFGSTAVDALSAAACAQLEAEAASAGYCASMPLNPGLVEWPVDVGQPEIFSLLDTDAIGVTLNDSAQMIPRKSASLVIGFAPTPFAAGQVCDFCALRATCRYQSRDAHARQ